MGRLRIAPLTVKATCRFVGEHHRHCRPPSGGLFAAAVYDGPTLAGVAIAGRPVARGLDDGETVEITRVCTTGAKNACSMLYAALCRAAAAIGYERAVTYTLDEEMGASVRAAGFELVARIKGRASWTTPSRPRADAGKRPAGDKVRWERRLGDR
ncbi:MAG: hypothetical protein K2P78_14605 [Gemmataceae bacterium]|nr:hypothetical protein [Gemmataceae bacterium]